MPALCHSLPFPTAYTQVTLTHTTSSCQLALKIKDYTFAYKCSIYILTKAFFQSLYYYLYTSLIKKKKGRALRTQTHYNPEVSLFLLQYNLQLKYKSWAQTAYMGSLVSSLAAVIQLWLLLLNLSLFIPFHFPAAPAELEFFLLSPFYINSRKLRRKHAGPCLQFVWKHLHIYKPELNHLINCCSN